MTQSELIEKQEMPRRGILEARRRINSVIKGDSTSLSLADLALRKLPESMAGLIHISSLDLSGNNLRQLPEWIGQLTKLRTLIVTGGRFAELPEVIRKLKNLRKLSFVGVGLKEVPDWICELSDLKYVSFSRNPLKTIPQSFSELHKLVGVSLDNCNLSEIPFSLSTNPRLEEIYLKGNSGITIPEEILESRDAKTILNYYTRISVANGKSGRLKSEPLNEFKLVLVGRGGVGKTTLAHKLITDEFMPSARTDGISIRDWTIKCGNDAVTAHVWDFGGQEIMHGTHRFFITSRSLYLILISGRENSEDTDAEYWLSLVKSLAGNVPIVVVLNRYGEYPFELNQGLLRSKFGDRIRFVACDALQDIGISDLRKIISLEASAMPELRKLFPAEWVAIKNELPKQRCEWMSFDDFLKFCKKFGENDPQACEELVSFLHDLGLMLSYRKDEALRRLGVLNPHWVTRGIYKIITSQELRDKGAKLTLNDFANLLDEREYPKCLHAYLLALMRKFELCFPLDDTGNNYLVPELLTKEEPPLVDKEFIPANCLGFVYRYENALPHGLLPRFIVHTYVHREPKFTWRSGVVLEWGNARALVRGDIPGRVIYIWISGPVLHSRALLTVIRTHFERIHESYKGLPVNECVPVMGRPDVEVMYSTLLKYHHHRMDDMIVEMGNGLGRIDVREALANVGGPSKELRRSATDRYEWEVLGTPGPLSLFISYAHADETYCDQLRGALTIYERGGELEVWDDTKIIPGQRWEKEILRKLESADIIVLLISTDFIRSEYCIQIEMERALKRDERGKCAIVPIVVRECRFDKLKVGKIQAILPNGKPIKNNRDRDVAWKQVTRKLDAVIAQLRVR